MKKKGLIIAGGILIIAVIAIVVCVVFGGNKDNTQTPAAELSGTWCVYQYADTKVENEFMVFGDGSVSDYRDGKETPYITSTYTYEDGKLVMPEVAKEFAVRIVSDNNIILVEPDTREWKLVKVSNGDRDIKALTPAELAGEYTVVSVAGEQRQNEMMTFTETTLCDTRDCKQYLACAYELVSGNLLKASEISKEYYVFKNGNIVMLIDKADRYVWELVAK